MLLSDYQLVLPECFRNEDYTNTVYAMRDPKRTQQYIILDNGAAEGEAWHPVALWHVAKEFKCDEIVIPDMLGEKNGTLDLLEDFVAQMTMEQIHAFNWMGVIQGQTWEEFLDCAEAFAEMDFVTTIGIPRHAVQTIGHSNARINLAHHIHYRWPKLQIHFLGSSSYNLSEAKLLAEACPYARGMDTSLPYFAAHHRVEIDDLSAPFIARPDPYFERPASDFPIGLLEYNMRILKGWCMSHG